MSTIIPDGQKDNESTAPPMKTAISGGYGTSSGDGDGVSDGGMMNGINIKEAMAILSIRAKNGGNNGIQPDPELQKMGQTLDLGGDSGSGTECTSSSPDSELVKSEREAMAKQAQGQTTEEQAQEQTNAEQDDSKAMKVKEKLRQQSPAELLQTLFQLQKERVGAYRKFNDGLSLVLKSGNFSQYTHLASSITATFVVLSNSIREILSLFIDLSKSSSSSSSSSNQNVVKDVAKWIKELQLLEKEKLHFTAALHLEQMRERNEVSNLENSENGNENDNHSSSSSNNAGDIMGSGGGGSEKIVSLLRDSVTSLQSKVFGIVEQINDILEELRYAAADLDE